MYGCNNGMMGGWGWLGGLFSLLAVALIIGGILLAIRQYTRPTSGTAAPASSAEAILAERYARGEIDDQEYQQRLAVLRTGR